jgi:hypothetical protein
VTRKVGLENVVKRFSLEEPINQLHHGLRSNNRREREPRGEYPSKTELMVKE